jgi:hypothetical protein
MADPVRFSCSVRLSNTSQLRREVGRLADNRLLLSEPVPIRSPTTTNPVAMPTRLCSGALDFNAPALGPTPAPHAPPARRHPHGPAGIRSRPARHRLESLIESFIELMSQVFMLPIFHRRTSC